MTLPNSMGGQRPEVEILLLIIGKNGYRGAINAGRGGAAAFSWMDSIGFKPGHDGQEEGDREREESRPEGRCWLRAPRSEVGSEERDRGV